jgi:hypothetical protein
MEFIIEDFVHGRHGTHGKNANAEKAVRELKRMTMFLIIGSDFFCVSLSVCSVPSVDKGILIPSIGGSLHEEDCPG